MKMRKQIVFGTCHACRVFLSILGVVILTISLTTCGSGSQTSVTPPVGNTQVVVLLTSTANDRLVAYDALIATIALVDKTGKSTAVFTNPVSFGPLGEWMHLNDDSVPLPATTVPQGTYTSAVVTVDGCSFTTLTFAPPENPTAGFIMSVFAQGVCAQGTGVAKVNLPNPITIAGAAMALSLNLQISQSYTLDATANPQTYTIDPLFTLTPVSIAAQPTNESNGKVTVIDALVSSVGTDGKTVTAQTSDTPP